MFAVSPIDNCPHLTGTLREEGYSLQVNVRDSPCCVCKDCSENWLCLKCNELYCSRYVKGHFLNHHENDNTHNIGISMADLSVWCYHCESYIVDPRLRDVLTNLRGKHKHVTPNEIPAPVTTTSTRVILPYEQESTWKNIASLLSSSIDNTESLVTVISQVLEGRGIKSSDGYGALSDAISRSTDFFSRTLPYMQKLVLQSKELLPTVLPILSTGKEGKVTLSREQCACILANSFFCTFNRNSAEEYWNKNNIPSINLDDMYGSSINKGPKVAKLLMLFNYFDRLIEEIPTGTVTFERQLLSDVPTYASLDVPLLDVDIKSKGSIEDSPEALQVDFANEFIGGASISYGCVQEEIRFSLCPECNVSRLFCERMNEKESIVIKGAVQFSSYTGYAYDLKYGGNYVDKNFDSTTGENLNHLVAMDALIFSSNQLSQWKKEKIDRELNKAFVAFQNTDRVVSTGNWGCGAFAGDKQLKFVIQWIAASAAGRNLIYYTFGSEELGQDLAQFYNKLKTNNVTVGALYQAVQRVYGLHKNIYELPNTLALLNTLL